MPSSPGDILESDWKTFRTLRVIALNRYCEHVLAETREISLNSKKTHHERYLDVFKFLEDRDELIVIAFNDARRSTAFRQLLVIRKHALLTDDEMLQFSPELRTRVETVLNML